MKKILTLFKRVFDERGKIVDVLPEFTDEKCKQAYYKGIPTLKLDGSCCCIHGGKLYKRYDAKKGRTIPENAILCEPFPDPVTGHQPCWVPVDPLNPSDKWFIAASDMMFDNLEFKVEEFKGDGTYEAIGKHFNGNPYNIDYDILVRHGEYPYSIERRGNSPKESLEIMRAFLKNHYIEGLVFWLDGEPVCKIKRSDFGFEWGNKCK